MSDRAAPFPHTYLLFALNYYQTKSERDQLYMHTSLFADDASFILDGSNKSFENFIRILDKFTNISGLKLNAKSAKFYA